MSEPSTLDTELLEKYFNAFFARDYLNVARILAMSDTLHRAFMSGVTELLASGQLTKKDLETGVTIELAKHLLN